MGDDEACDVSGNEASNSVQISLKEGFSNTSKVRKTMYTQKEFDQYVSNYIVDGVLPLNHVETESFKELMQQLAPSKLAKPSQFLNHIHPNLYS
jgi:hypothetical protein